MGVERFLRIKLLAVFVFILSLSNFAAADSNKSIKQDSSILFVDFTDYFLSVQAQDVNINDLFKEISSKTGVKIISESPLDCQITIDFKKKGFTRGMKQILSRLSPGEYRGHFKLGETFSGSIYTIQKISEKEISARQEKASDFNSQGEKLLKEGKDYQAYNYFIKALRSDPNFLPAHKNLVKIYDLWKDYEKLSERMEKVVKLESDDPQNYLLLADAYKESYHHDKALENYSKFISKSQKKVGLYKAETSLAQLNTKKNKAYYLKISETRNLIRERQFEKARETLNQALSIDPSSTKAYELLAMVNELKGVFEAAIEWRKKLEKLAPDDCKNLLFLSRDLRILSDQKAALEYLHKAKQMSETEYMKILIEKEQKLIK